MISQGTIRAGMGGWTFEPWDTSFYPDKLSKAKQLHYASRQVPSIEVNGTYYSSFKEPTFVKWAGEAPDGFVYSVKGNRFVTNRRVLGEAGESMTRFLGSGIAALGDKLGPILWQFAPTKKFDADDFEAFLKLLPEKQDGVALRHALEVRNDSFSVPEFVSLARKYKAAIVYADHAKYPGIADITGDFIYARLQTGSDDNPDCYTPKGLDEWAARVKTWAQGKQPADLRRADPTFDAPVKPRDVFVYFITEGKVRAPFGAMALMKRVS
ncbi:MULTISPECIES: DUF72 domain-containing protein [unclassified Mesorhizobium]|uniref:DUF72 domain-containing protein n=1 Tax=unclassified Mesorhizobium TaxID=325217 RepID=UPI0003CF0B8E|nr:MULTISPECIES: DUF72 domain-containing protein [unclassified Mesorhizobium]ESX15775.1 hypothetical protein X766_23580 [Mesorhizobium sp. LSJC255A00]ESX31338.1 hypothetical protein X765_00180 [Mesorhizobium sp. LSHC440B00]ESX38018.1 hypothetical protein X764_22770 [Mesorhizobium sp. LSHC440A00]ESX39941.1 hypothetical protein X763_08230 [Mesorhizobium sp. LSHC432A00]ESX45572.1 hypothetical protein X762_25735 [Mesorhizobium sp. LSHC426A00]